jgi:hypothetical protein
MEIALRHETADGIRVRPARVRPDEDKSKASSGVPELLKAAP